MTKRIVGLDLGIGSIGWAVVDEDNRRIDDLGVRIFDSGEEGATKAADRASQVRRAKRSIRRQNRRTKQRKIYLKSCLEHVGIIRVEDIHEAFRTKGFNPDVFRYRAEGLERRLTPIEIASVLLNFANYRGYREFYESEDSEDEKGKVKKAESEMRKLYQGLSREKGYQTVGEMIYRDSVFRDSHGKVSFRNNAQKDSNGKNIVTFRYLVPREYLEAEADFLLNRQAEYYEQLTPDNVALLVSAVFRQRDFEDGPGPNKVKNATSYNAMRKTSHGHQVYSGFEEMIGKCPFYPEERRGTRNSQLFEMYMLINVLSQYTFLKNDEEIVFPAPLVFELRNQLFASKGTITTKDFVAFCKKNELIPAKSSDDEKKERNFISCKYIKFLTNDEIFPEAYQKAFSEETYADPNALSTKLGRVLSQYATPRRRKDEIKNLVDEQVFIDWDHADKIKNTPSSGEASVSERYMREAVDAFLSGVKYGNFQSEFLRTHAKSVSYRPVLFSAGRIPPIQDSDLIRNPVVYRTVNETRKVLNAIMRIYKGVEQINIEVAREVGNSFEQRSEIAKGQREREKKNLTEQDNLTRLLLSKGYSISTSDSLILKYGLWESQNKQCMYSGAEISFEQLMTNDVQVDHIIAQSIVLDETQNNKVLVLTAENQRKGNRLPMEYMNEEQRDAFRTRVNHLRYSKKITKTKAAYLLLEELTDETISGFVDRNLNDTKYISKYICEYLRQGFGDKIQINAIKGNVTSRFRRRWLRRDKAHPTTSVYGYDEKGRDLHYYHHAVDAVVLANLKRSYIELAQDYLKIESMRRDYDRLARKGESSTAKRIYDEIPIERAKTIEKMQKHYSFSPEFTSNLLDYGYVPSLCRDIRDEIECRVPLNISMRQQQFEDTLSGRYKLRKGIRFALEELDEEGNSADDQVHVETRISDDVLELINEALGMADLGYSAVTPNGEVVPVESDKDRITLKDLRKLIIDPSVSDYVDNIEMLTEAQYQERTIAFYGESEFSKKVRLPYVSFKIDRTYRASMVSSDNPVQLAKTGCKTFLELEQKMKTDLKCPYYVRFNTGINESGNFTIYDARSYYCTEVFCDQDGKVDIRGIRYVDVRKQNGRLTLLKLLPEGCKHVIYLFKNEYIEVRDKKGKMKNKGFGAYRGVENIQQQTCKIRLFSNKGLNGRDNVLVLDRNTSKYEVSILGHNEGIIRCGDQSLFTPVTD